MTQAHNPFGLFMAICFLLIVACTELSAQETDYFAVRKINDYLYAFVTPEPTLELVDGNSYAIVTEDGVFMIDSHHLPIIAEANIAVLKTLTDQPVRYLLNTHWHGDHNTANFVWAAAYPYLPIIAHAKTYEIQARRKPDWVKRFREGQFDTYVRYFDSLITSGINEQGKPLTAPERDRNERLLHLLRKYADDSRRVEVSLPNITFDSRMVLQLGGTEIQIKHAGKANTPGDAFVWLPKDSILITGDILVHPIPYCFGSFFSDWVATLDTMLALNPRIILPGHGEPMTDTTYLRTVRDMFASLVEQAERGFAQGITTPDSLKNVIDLSAFRAKLAGDDYDKNWAFENFMLDPAVTRILNQLKGELGDDTKAN